MTANKKNSGPLKVARFILHLLLNIVFYLVIIYGVAKAGTEIYDISYQVFGSKGGPEATAKEVQVQIGKGEATMNVARKLEQSKVIDNKYSFYLNAKLMERMIMPGTHTLNTSMNFNDIFTVLATPQQEEDQEEETGSSEGENSQTEETETESKEETTSSDGTE